MLQDHLADISGDRRDRSRLNPFAFASDTTLRFILLFVFVIAADIRRWHGLAWTGFDLTQKLDECLNGAPMIGMAALLDPAKLQECYRPLLFYEIPAIAIGLLLLAAVTGAIYWWYPTWEVRRLKLTPLDPSEAPELSATLNELCTIAGLRRSPEFLWNPVIGSHLALAFGRVGAYRVGFTGALAVLHNTDPAGFRIVMLHELAHIRNGDVERAYMALALWWGFLVAAMLPYLVVSVSRSMDTADAVVLLAEAMIITGIVLLTRNAVLRARELYADARSFAWARDEAAFTRMLVGLLPVGGIRRLLSPHPDPARRRRLLHDADEMFRFGFWDAFGVGATASFIAVTFAFVAGSRFLQGVPENMAALFALLALPTAIAVPLVAGAASIAIWRTTFLALMREGTANHVLRTVCALAAGVVLSGPAFGAAVTLHAGTGGEGHKFVEQIAVPWFSVLVGALGIAGILIVILAGGLVLFLKWVEAGAISWLSVALRAPSPRAPFGISIFVASILAWGWFCLGFLVIGSAWLALRETESSSALTVFWLSLIANTIFPLNLIAWVGLVAFWAFPLAAGLWRPRADTKANTEWPFMDAAPRALPLVEPPLRLRRALLIGVAGGLAAGVALPWLRLPLPPGALHEVGYPGTAGGAAILSMTMTCMMVQGAIAALVALTIPRLSIPHAIFAAFVAGWILAVAEVLQLLAMGAAIGTALELVLAPVVFGGALLALVAAVVVAVLRMPADTVFARRLRVRTPS